MKIPVVQGIIDRRILVNYRIDPKVLASILPNPFRPQIVSGAAIGGICLIGLKHLHPRFLPSFLGVSSENAAHRFAVEWEQAGERRTGVFIPRRDTSSRFNVLAGGRFFPGKHHHARFRSTARNGHYRVAVDSDDRLMHVAVEGHIASELPKTSVFRSLQDASEFFEHGSLGYSASSQRDRFDALELRSFDWKVEPLAVERVESSFFDDRARFPPGTVKIDSALLMRRISHDWHARQSLNAGVDAVALAREEPARSHAR